MPDYKLYCFGEFGNAYKVALTLELAGCAWQARFVDFFNGETRSTVFKSLNPMGEVPVLIHGDIRLSQSGVIQEYIPDQTGQLGGQVAAHRRDGSVDHPPNLPAIECGVAPDGGEQHRAQVEGEGDEECEPLHPHQLISCLQIESGALR